MSVSQKDLMVSYANLRLENGFLTDASFMDAWRKDPIKWAYIFSVRQALIESFT